MVVVKVGLVAQVVDGTVISDAIEYISWLSYDATIRYQLMRGKRRAGALLLHELA